MCTFKNSAISNFYIGNCKAPTKDYLLRFSIRARNDTLWTPAKKAVINGSTNPYCNCGNERYCNTLHMLNNCQFNMKGMTERHNKVQNRVVDAIEKHSKVTRQEIEVNKSIQINGIDLEELSRLRPDIQYWTKELVEGIEVNTLNLIEIAVQFGRALNAKEDTLKAKRQEKINKYGCLIKTINKKFEEVNERGKKYQIKFDPFVVSSLGAMPNASIKVLEKILGCSKNTTKLSAKRICIDALIGSFGIWRNAKDGIYNLMKSQRTLRDVEENNQAEDGEQGDTKQNLDVLINETMFGDEAKEKQMIKTMSEESDVDVVEDCLGKAIDTETNMNEIMISEDEKITQLYGDGETNRNCEKEIES
ncbi:MAG: hypothetical protein Ta2E_11960 [Mycoplasmoidaceae bacterium]|nr:MAG: hypothetical protein Ta2E_11960 [Mycoplasmoidaceae bacterium]